LNLNYYYANLHDNKQLLQRVNVLLIDEIVIDFLAANIF